ncbi:Cobalamin-independent synthase, Catalytic domain [Actinacidiphila paucisporea]|uniref:Cobalamin-independent synthase, Catalytic domain n=1 Tax=Actinacidiphila paucisporea TaxID=310782 RepID=A0A1M7L445_9ACTN|nr:Cobalamin-independent synthase, Catalytic domain [Actinacidiphila paucisporea]
MHLPEATATGVGSLPGGDAREAARVATEATQGMAFLPELPARGPGADMIGRSLGLLAEMYARVEPSGWRFGDRPGRDSKRARSWLGEDLDALEEFTQGYQGLLKVQAVGPWTLAASVETRHGEAALRDPGACRDLAASLTEGLTDHLADVRRRVPGAQVALQLDEPSLAEVLRGQIRTASGYRTYRSVDRVVVESALRELIAAADVPVTVHSCAADVPFALLRRAGAAGISFDMDLLTERDWDEFGEAAEAGTALFAGVVPGKDAPLSDPAGSVSGVRALWRRLGLAPGALGSSVAVTPSCGLAGASPAYARAALVHCAKAARSLVDNPE